ncbi:hypothetical protein HK100_003049 [Physocladia obscura]|uniref:CRAL-TRIO domain-containing protein n=1 Tax=Physocladia obscura TaxID=109957 RepID=A0AAD5XEY8_9FUNG|nr:hypothetical protein HK100_003049 [Physocladia obscura]
MFSRKEATTPSQTKSLPPILSPPSPPPLPQDYPFNTLSPDQKLLYNRIRTKINQIINPTNSLTPLTGFAIPGEIEWASDETIVRYMNASKFDEAKCVAMITKTLQWRRDYRPDLISPEEVEAESTNGKAYWHGFDKSNRPIFILNESRTKTDHPDRFVRFIIFNLENGIKLCPPGVSQISAIADVEGVRMFHTNPISVTTKLADILQVLAKILLPFVDPVTKSKIHFTTVTAPKKESDQQTSDDTQSTTGETGGWVSGLDVLVDSTQLPVALGGAYTYEYQHDVYWNMFVKTVGKSDQ